MIAQKLDNYGRRRENVLLFTLVALLTAGGCSPNQDYFREMNDTSVRFVLADNGSLSSFSSAAELTEMGPAFGEGNSYIVLAPTDAAFLLNGLTATTIRTSSATWLSRTIKSHVLEDFLDLNDLPLMGRQRLFTQQGHPVYVTKWLHDEEILFTVNGIRAQPRALEASNGRIYVLERLLQDRSFQHVLEAVQARHDMSLFSYAISYAEMEQELEQIGECSVFIPTNGAMASSGYGSFQAIQSLPKEEWQTIIRNHLINRMLFVSDVGLSVSMNMTGRYPVEVVLPNGTIRSNVTITGSRGIARVPTHNNQSIELVFSEGYSSAEYGYRLHIQDRTVAGAHVSPSVKDIVTDNGVIHSINKVLEF